MEFFDSYDDIKSNTERYPYINGKTLGIYTCEVVSVDIKNSQKPSKRGSEFCVANVRILNAEGPVALKPDSIATLYFDFDPAEDEYGFQKADAKAMLNSLIENPTKERIMSALASGELPGTTFKAAIVRAPTKKGKLVTKYFFSNAESTPALPAGATLEPATE